MCFVLFIGEKQVSYTHQNVICHTHTHTNAHINLHMSDLSVAEVSGCNNNVSLFSAKVVSAFI